MEYSMDRDSHPFSRLPGLRNSPVGIFIFPTKQLFFFPSSMSSQFPAVSSSRHRPPPSTASSSVSAAEPAFSSSRRRITSSGIHRIQQRTGVRFFISFRPVLIRIIPFSVVLSTSSSSQQKNKASTVSTAGVRIFSPHRLPRFSIGSQPSSSRLSGKQGNRPHQLIEPSQHREPSSSHGSSRPTSSSSSQRFCISQAAGLLLHPRRSSSTKQGNRRLQHSDPILLPHLPATAISSVSFFLASDSSSSASPLPLPTGRHHQPTVSSSSSISRNRGESVEDDDVARKQNKPGERKLENALKTRESRVGPIANLFSQLDLVSFNV